MSITENTTIEEWVGENYPIGISIFNDKYRDNNEILYYWLYRVCNGDEEVMKIVADKLFLFGGRILSYRNINGPNRLDLDSFKDDAQIIKLLRKISMSNCYLVSAPEDNIPSIYEAAMKMAITMSRGGGVGVDISKLSPRGAIINNAAKTTSGAVSFMELFDATSALICQNGRRGALMISLSCDHPDIEEFIEVKKDLDKINKANISIRFNDKFMEAAKNNKDFELSFTRKETGETISKIINARELLRKFAQSNWEMGEPGALFWDTATNYNMLCNTPDFHYDGVNPCGELMLPAGGACLLGSLNLSEFVNNPFTSEAEFNFDKFKKTVKIAVRALNEVLDEGAPLHPLEEQRESVKKWRQIGLGIMGLADMLVKMGITYGSEESIELCDSIGFAMDNTAIAASAMLAKEYGSYDGYIEEAVMTTEFFINNTTDYTKRLVKKYGLRNSQLFAIAPTGSIANLIGVSNGVEPIFANSYVRKTESLNEGKETYYKVYTKVVQEYMDKFGLDDESKLPEYFVTALDMDYHKKIDMQSIWQKHIDSSISSTCNIPEDITIEEVEDLYFYAYEKKLKGITVFRNNCSRKGILTTENKKEEVPTTRYNEDITIDEKDLIGKKRKLMTGCGSLHLMANFNKYTGDLVETFLMKGSTGGCNNFMVGLSRMISKAAKKGTSVDEIVDQLSSTGICPSYASRKATKGDTSLGSCCPMAVGYALKEMHKEMLEELKDNIKDIKEEKKEYEYKIEKDENLCPQCGAKLEPIQGCIQCNSCGWTRC